MPKDPFAQYLEQTARATAGFGLGYDVGDDDVGDDDVGDDEAGYDVGAARHNRKRIVRARARAIDKFDRVYGSAAREAGSALPEMAVGYSAQALADAATFTLSFNAPQACILTGINMNATAAGLFEGTQLYDCQLSISGQPVGGYPKFGPSRFQADSLNRRLEPIEVDTSVPIVFTATVLAAAGTPLFEVEIMATRIVSGLRFASR